MPLIAEHGGERILATKDGPRKAACPECAGDMQAKTGDIVTWHWAHVHKHESDAPPCAGSGETEWHLGWKATCDDPRRIEVAKGNRRADVLHKAGWAIEFQHSAISPQEITGRETDWRGRVIWVFDLRDAYAEGRFGHYKMNHEDRVSHALWWSWSKQSITDYAAKKKAVAFLDLGETGLILVGGWHTHLSPRRGFGWPVGQRDFVDAVVNGAMVPSAPKYGQHPNIEMWRAGIPESSMLRRGSKEDVARIGPQGHIDWSHSSHWNGGRRWSCHLCGLPALLLDDAGRPAHKRCVEERLPAATRNERRSA
jgi:competence protein CoiA